MQKIRGFSLLEVMVSVGLTGVIAVLLASLIQNANKSIVITKQDLQARQTITEMQRLLEHPDHCKSTFSTDSSGAAINISAVPSEAAPIPSNPAQLVLRRGSTPWYGPTVVRNGLPAGIFGLGTERLKMSSLKIIKRVDLGVIPGATAGTERMHSVTVQAVMLKPKSNSGIDAFYTATEKTPYYATFNIRVSTLDWVINGCMGDFSPYEEEACLVAQGSWDSTNKKCITDKLCFVSYSYVSTSPTNCIRNYSDGQRFLSAYCTWTNGGTVACPPTMIAIGVDETLQRIRCCRYILERESF